MLLLSIAFVPLSAQNRPFTVENSLLHSSQYSIQYWNTENGLPQNSVIAIAQTPANFLWFGTFQGLVRFDGVSFRIFDAADWGDECGSGATKLHVDAAGRLWISTSKCLLRYENGEFISLGSLQSWNASSFTEDSLGNFYAATEHGIHRYDTADQQTELFRTSSVIYGIHANPDGQVYYATLEGLFRLGDTLPLAPPPNSPFAILVTVGPEAFVYKAGDALYQWEGGRMTPAKNLEHLQARDVIAYYERNGTALTWARDTLRVLRGGRTDRLASVAALRGAKVASMFVDREDVIWIGTNEGGIFKLEEKLIMTIDSRQGLIGDPTLAVYLGPDTTLWIATNCEGVTHIGEDGPEYFAEKPVDCNWTILVDRVTGAVYFGSYGNGVLQQKDGQRIRMSDPDGLNRYIIFALYQDREDVIWVGTDRGIGKLESGRGDTVLVDPRLDSTRVNSISEDARGRLVISSEAGVFFWDRGKNDIEIVDKSAGLCHNTARWVHEDAEGAYWITTYGGGLARYKDGKAVCIHSRVAEISDDLSGLHEDANGIFWLSSNHGIYAIERHALNDFIDGKADYVETRHFGREDGLLSIECNGGFQQPIMVDEVGTMWIPTMRGIAVVDPNKLPAISAPRIFIDRLVTADSSYNPRQLPVRLPAFQDLEIHFVAPNSTAPLQVRYEYKLDGLQDHWVTADRRRVAYFTVVPPGDYTFHVRIRGTEQTASIPFRVFTPFYLTWWFRGLVLLLITALIFFLVRTRIRSIRQKEVKQSRLERKFAMLELKALQSQLNPHFIFNCLNSIQHLFFIDDDLRANTYLSKFSILMRLFLEHSKSNWISLAQEIELLQLYVDLEMLQFDNPFEFELEIDTDLDPELIEIPSMIFQPHVENAIQHGLKNLSRKGHLHLTFKMEQEDLIGIVRDDGVGREKARELRHLRKKDHKSRGQEMIRERVDLLNQMENLNIQLDVRDLVAADGEPAGTVVTIRIPSKFKL